MNRVFLSIFFSISVLAPMAIQADQLVTNGGFETGDLSGWTQSGNSTPDNTGVAMATGTVTAHTGSYYAYLGPQGSDGYLSQTLNTVAGELYQITFWLASDGATPSDFSAVFDGNTLLSQNNPLSSDWTEYSYSAIASSDATVLQFGFRDDPGYLSLDDVSVSSVSSTPEPSTWGFAGIGGLSLTALGYLRKRRNANREATL